MYCLRTTQLRDLNYAFCIDLFRSLQLVTDFHIVKELLMQASMVSSLLAMRVNRITLRPVTTLSIAFPHSVGMVEPRRIELLTSCVQGRRSPS